MIINSGKNIWSTTKETIEALPILDHEEAEMSNEAAVIAAKGAEVFLHLTHVLSQLEYFLPPPWHKKTDSNQFNNATNS